MKIKKIRENKEQFMSLLLLGDEQENMISRYLEKGELFALYDTASGAAIAADVVGGGLQDYSMSDMVASPHYSGLT